MSRKAILLALAVSAMVVCAAPSPVSAEETIGEVLSSWCEWRHSIDWFPVKEREPGRVPGRPVDMPVDRSYDRLVDRP